MITMSKELRRIILGACLFAIAGTVIYTWVTAPLVLYAFMGLFAVGLVYGGYMNRTYIRSEVRRVIDEWKFKQEAS